MNAGRRLRSERTSWRLFIVSPIVAWLLDQDNEIVTEKAKEERF